LSNVTEVPVNKRWYNLFVSVGEQPEGEADASKGPGEGATAAQAVADIAASLPAEARFSTPVSNPTSFDQIYDSAEIHAPDHGYTILKVAEMLQSEHIRGLPAEVKRNSILLALEASNVKLQDVIEDAVKRDRALDTYERVLEKSVNDLESTRSQEKKKLQAEMERMVAEYHAKIQAAEDEVAKEKEKFYGWRLQKQQEEKKISDAVGYFVSENPITTSSIAAPPSPPKA
jgi:hypothetical protein